MIVAAVLFGFAINRSGKLDDLSDKAFHKDAMFDNQVKPVDADIEELQNQYYVFSCGNGTQELRGANRLTFKGIGMDTVQVINDGIVDNLPKKSAAWVRRWFELVEDVPANLTLSVNYDLVDQEVEVLIGHGRRILKKHRDWISKMEEHLSEFPLDSGMWLFISKSGWILGTGRPVEVVTTTGYIVTGDKSGFPVREHREHVIAFVELEILSVQNESDYEMCGYQKIEEIFGSQQGRYDPIIKYC